MLMYTIEPIEKVLGLECSNSTENDFKVENTRPSADLTSLSKYLSPKKINTQCDFSR